MSKGKWPFKPDHITNDGPLANPYDIRSLKYGSISDEFLQTTRKRRENLKKLTGTGIISNDYLEGLQTTICANLGNPTTVVEFSTEGETVRTDSRLLFFSMHGPCKIFREYTNEEACLECDNCYAKLFYKLSLGDDLINQVRKRLGESSFISGNMEDGLYCEIVRDSRRPYLEYDCSLLGYRELIFPIFFEEKVLAVFFVGQLCLRERLAAISEQQQVSFEKTSGILIKYCADEGKRKQLAEEVRIAHETWVGDESHIIEDGDYKDFISKAITELDGLERILDQQTNIRRGECIREHIDAIIHDFSDRLWETPDTAEEKWGLLWHNTDESLKQFVKAFSLRYIVVFANRSFETESASFLDVVSKAGKPPQELEELINSKEMKFDLTKVPSDVRHQLTTSLEKPRLFHGIDVDKARINEAYNLLRIFPVPFFPNATLVVLVGYMKDYPLRSVENKPYEQLGDASQTFYTLLLSTFSATLASIAEERRQRALGRMTHELRGPITAIKGATESIIETRGSKTFFDFDYPGDIWSWTELMTRVIENADVYRYVYKGEMDIRPEKVFLLTDVIAPAIRQVKLLLEERSFSRRNITYIGFEKFPSLWLDRNRFQQIVFNLLSNSIKYAYDDPGSFEVEIEGIEKGEYFYFYVRDWGTGIETEESEKVFEEEFRNGRSIDMNVTGQGLGLWIVKQIIDRHEGKVRVSNSHHPMEIEIKLPYWLTSRPPRKKDS